LLAIWRIRHGVDLVVLGQVMFMTGRIVPHLDRKAELCYEFGARLAIDAYHSAGVSRIDVSPIEADFLIGRSYKYLRGRPRAAFLYISPDTVAGLRPWLRQSRVALRMRPRSPRCAGTIEK
jgi:kynureninase